MGIGGTMIFIYHIIYPMIVVKKAIQKIHVLIIMKMGNVIRLVKPMKY